MPKPNDMCPCGSGKKYKYCHMVEDRQREAQVLATDRAARELRLALVNHAQTDSYKKDVEEALKLYWDGHYNLNNWTRMSSDEAVRFFDWFVFDYVGLTGKRLIEVFAKERAEQLDDKQRALLPDWLAASPGSAYVVEDTGEDSITLRDLFTGETSEVYDPVGSAHAEPGEILLARLLPVNGRLQLSGATVRLPGSEAENLKAFINDKFQEYKATRPWGQWKDFLRGWAYLFAHFALQEAERAGRPAVAAESPQANRIARRAEKAVQRIRRK